jgi:SpoVK/Ycf46/Vps4 family AAA+-type ATPase
MSGGAIRSGHAGLYIVSAEEARVEAEIKAVAEGLGYKLYAWSATEGLVNTVDGSAQQANDPMEAITAINDLPENTLVLLRDFHLFLEDKNPVLIRALKDELARSKTKGRTLIVLGCRQVLAPELEREFTVLDFALPDKQQLGIVLDGICQSAKLKLLKGDERDQVLDSATGLTSTEAENAYALAVIESGGVDSRIIRREKAQTVKKSGLLEVVNVCETLDSIGGLDLMKGWLLQRRDAFSTRAAEYGLPSPKGMLIVGVPGTGKSLSAKATASVFNRPLLKLDAGKLYGSLVGQSEGNLRSVIQVAEAIAPCVLWIDELEKGMAGSKSSGATDGGTSARVFGSFLSWMQEKRSHVFVIATANDVTQLPPELLRKGRWDEIWFTDLPNGEERQKIWEIQIKKYGRKPAEFDLRALVEMSVGYTGAEIEQAVIDALYAGFAEEQEPTTKVICQVTAESIPLSKLMAEQIDGLRKWAVGRARPATAPVKESRQRKIVA